MLSSINLGGAMLAPTAVTTMLLTAVAGCATPNGLQPTLMAHAGTVQAVRAVRATPAKPTLVLMYDAFADASGWEAVSSSLQQDGYNVVAVLAAPPLAVIGVAGNCAAGSGPMRPALRGGMGDLNGDGYVCTQYFRSMDGDTLRVTVDNDVPTPDSAQVELQYVFNG